MNKLHLASNEKRSILTGMLVLAFILSLLSVDTQGGLLHSGGAVTAANLFSTLLHPDLSSEIISIALDATIKTFAYAMISISIALVFAFILGILASGILFKALWIRVLVRGIIGFLRAIHELIWAWFFVAAVGLNPLGAIAALAMPYAGYLGKIFADTLQEVPQAPINHLRLTGAKPLQLLFYGYLPQAFPTMLSYTMYRLECAIRSSSVLSFVGLGGLGMQIQLALQDLKYEQVWTYLAFLVGLVWLVDRWSFAIRKRVRA